MAMPNIETLGDDAAFAVSDLLSEDEWLDFDDKSALEKIQYRYLHADCDDFAIVLHRATGWDVVSVATSQGPLHRLVEDPSGRLLDVRGWSVESDLLSLYGTKKVHIGRPGGALASHSCLTDDEDFHAVLAVMLQLEVEPFVSEVRPQILKFAERVGMDTSMPTCSSSLRP